MIQTTIITVDAIVAIVVQAQVITELVLELMLFQIQTQMAEQDAYVAITEEDNYNIKRLERVAKRE